MFTILVLHQRIWHRYWNNSRDNIGLNALDLSDLSSNSHLRSKFGHGLNYIKFQHCTECAATSSFAVMFFHWYELHSPYSKIIRDKFLIVHCYRLFLYIRYYRYLFYVYFFKVFFNQGSPIGGHAMHVHLEYFKE